MLNDIALTLPTVDQFVYLFEPNKPLGEPKKAKIHDQMKTLNGLSGIEYYVSVKGGSGKLFWIPIEYTFSTEEEALAVKESFINAKDNEPKRNLQKLWDEICLEKRWRGAVKWTRGGKDA